MSDPERIFDTERAATLERKARGGLNAVMQPGVNRSLYNLYEMGQRARFFGNLSNPIPKETSDKTFELDNTYGELSY